MAENKQNFAGFIGPSYTARSQRMDCQRTVNMYMELDPMPTGGKGGQPACLLPTPGLDLVANIGTHPIRCIYSQNNANVAYAVTYNQVYRIDSLTGTPTLLTGNLLTESGTVQMTDNGTQIIIVDGQFGYYITIGTNTVNQIISNNFFPTQTITFQDTYFIGVEYGTQGMFVSNPNDVTFPALNVSYKEGNPDILVAAVSLDRQLFMLGSSTGEIWSDVGASSVTPFQRQDGRNSNVGTISPYTVKTLSDSLYWVGTNTQGGGVIFNLQNSIPTRISTNAIEYAIQGYGGDLSKATAYSYQQEGHYFYCVNFDKADTTWVFDTTIGQWSERQSQLNGHTGRHLVENHCNFNGTHLCGDYQTGNIYKYNLETYTDNGQPIVRLRQSPHYSKNLNRIFYKLLEIDCQFGVGLTGVPALGNGVNPQVTLQCSDDGGLTWGNPIYGRLGTEGSFLTRCRFQRLGSSRDRVFRVICSEPVRFVMLSAMIDVEEGEA